MKIKAIDQMSCLRKAATQIICLINSLEEIVNMKVIGLKIQLIKWLSNHKDKDFQ